MATPSPICRWILARKLSVLCVVSASLCGIASCAEATHGTQSSARSAPATLEVSVFVVPVLQARTGMPPKLQQTPITFRLESPPLTEIYEFRPLPRPEDADVEQKRPAVLRTLVVVPK